MWVLSVIDLYDATGNTTALRSFVPWVEQRLDHASSILTKWADPESGATPGGSPSLEWSRDDERMGFGFESPNLPEARQAFRALLVGAARRYSAVIGKLGNQTAETKYGEMAAVVEKEIRSAGRWWFDSFGMHASADAIIAGFVTAAESAAMVGPGGVFDDPAQLPSLSCFESFFILKALGSIGATEQAAYLVHRHWAGMLRLGDQDPRIRSLFRRFRFLSVHNELAGLFRRHDVLGAIRPAVGRLGRTDDRRPACKRHEPGHIDEPSLGDRSDIFPLQARAWAAASRAGVCGMAGRPAAAGQPDDDELGQGGCADTARPDHCRL